MKTILVAALTLTLATLALADGPKNIYRVLKFGPANVGIYCSNGADPTVIGSPVAVVSRLGEEVHAKC